MQEEEQRELEMKQLESARYEQEIKMAQREAEEEKIRRKQAYQRSACLCQDVQAAPPRRRICQVILRAFFSQQYTHVAATLRILICESLPGQHLMQSACCKATQECSERLSSTPVAVELYMQGPLCLLAQALG